MIKEDFDTHISFGCYIPGKELVEDSEEEDIHIMKENNKPKPIKADAFYNSKKIIVDLDKDDLDAEQIGFKERNSNIIYEEEEKDLPKE